MTYMVTGGTGFIGSWVVKAILEAGHDVVCIELVPNQARLDALLGANVARVTVVPGDVLHLHKLIETIRVHNVTHIAHIAAAVMAVCAANPPYAMQVNVTGFTNMLEACRITGIERMAWASSAGIFGGGYPRGEAIANDARPAPPTIYAASKVMGEALSVHYHDNYGIEAIGLRYTFVNGHGMPNSIGGKVLDELCRKASRGRGRRRPVGRRFTGLAMGWRCRKGDGTRPRCPADQDARLQYCRRQSSHGRRNRLRPLDPAGRPVDGGAGWARLQPPRRWGGGGGTWLQARMDDAAPVACPHRPGARGRRAAA